MTISSRRSLAVATFTAGVILLAGCASPGVFAPDETPTEMTAPAPTPTTEPGVPSSSPTETTDVWQTVETMNGTATFSAPSDWTVTIGGDTVENYDGETQWINSVLLEPAGENWVLQYSDNPYTDVGVCLPEEDWDVTDQEEVDSLTDEQIANATEDKRIYLDHAVTSWVQKTREGSWQAHIALTTADNFDCQPTHGVLDGERAVYFQASDEEGYTDQGLAFLIFDTKAEAEQWLESTDAETIQEVISTLVLSQVDANHMPAEH